MRWERDLRLECMSGSLLKREGISGRGGHDHDVEGTINDNNHVPESSPAPRVHINDHDHDHDHGLNSRTEAATLWKKRRLNSQVLDHADG